MGDYDTSIQLYAYSLELTFLLALELCGLNIHDDMKYKTRV